MQPATSRNRKETLHLLLPTSLDCEVEHRTLFPGWQTDLRMHHTLSWIRTWDFGNGNLSENGSTDSEGLYRIKGNKGSQILHFNFVYGSYTMKMTTKAISSINRYHESILKERSGWFLRFIFLIIIITEESMASMA